MGARWVNRNWSTAVADCAGVDTREADTYTHPKRSQLVRFLGEKASVEVDMFTMPLQVGDKLRLCSDSLWEMMRDPVAKPSRAVEALIQAALKGGAEIM